MAPFVMPKLSDTMEEGTILQWLVADGDTVTKGQDLVEVETDKANMTVQAPEAGVVTLLAGEGDVLEVGEPMATIGGGGEQTAAYEPTPVTETDGDAPGGTEDDSTGIPTAADGTADEIGAELDLEETYPGARAADAAERGSRAGAGAGARGRRAGAGARAAGRRPAGHPGGGLPAGPAPGPRDGRGHRDGARHRPRRAGGARRRRGRGARRGGRRPGRAPRRPPPRRRCGRMRPMARR